MKKNPLTVFAVSLLLILSQSANAISFSNPAVATIKSPSLNEKILQEYLSLTPRKYFELTGKRMNLAEKVSLKFSQRKIKRMMRKGKEVDMMAIAQKEKKSDFNLPGFALGVVLSLLGVLIAYLIDKNDSDLIKWAWIGAAAGAVLILLSLIL